MPFASVRAVLARVAKVLPRGASLPDEDWSARHRWMLVVLWTHFVGLLVWGGSTDLSLWPLALMVNTIAVCGIVATAHGLGRRLRAAVVCIGLLTSSTAVVYLMGGAIEGHFHFFVMVTLLALYEEWFPYLVAFAYVLAHHGLFGILSPHTVFNHEGGIHNPLKWAAIHALFIAGLGIVNLVSWRINETSRLLMAQSEERFRSAFDDAPTSMALVGLDSVVQQVNEAMCVRTGFSSSEMVGNPLGELIAEEDRGMSWFPSTDSGEIEVRYRRKDGTIGWGLWHHSILRDQHGQANAFISHCVDVTKRWHAEQELVWQANHDALTRLPSREFFIKKMEAALDRRDQSDATGVAVLFVDLDDFKSINDSLGHEAGDQLLTAVAERLSRVLRPEDVLARFGGDEFSVLLPGIVDEQQAVQVAGRLAEALRAPLVVAGVPRYVSASVGLRLSGPLDVDIDPKTILRDADAAMYRAKELGKGRCEVFDVSMRESAVERLDFEQGLRGALERDEFRLVFQPIVSLGDRRVSGVEALLRWHHPVHGVIAPMRFIPLIERNGLIVPIGAWVLREACRQFVSWDHGQLTLSVNVAVQQLASEGFVEVVQSLIEESRIAPERLCLEITETSMMEDLRFLVQTLDELKALGVRIAIDDFGVGYASLRQLRTRIPVDTLKIDRSFIAGMTNDRGDATIVEGIIRLAHALGLQVVAEGIETPEQAAILEQWSCQSGQGYLFAKPMDADAIAALMPVGRARAAADLRPCQPA